MTSRPTKKANEPKPAFERQVHDATELTCLGCGQRLGSVRRDKYGKRCRECGCTSMVMLANKQGDNHE